MSSTNSYARKALFYSHLLHFIPDFATALDGQAGSLYFSFSSVYTMDLRSGPQPRSVYAGPALTNARTEDETANLSP
jgi:hypothetical protein